MSLILTLDQSTSSTKALLFEASGRLVDRETADHRQSYPQPGWVEHDAEEIWQNTLQTLGALLARQSARISEIAGLSITNQRETIVVFARATGQPLLPAIVWQCRRSMALCAEQITAGHEALVQERTGLKIDPYFSASKIQWLVRHDAALRAKLDSGEALIGTMDAYLIYRLTRGAVFATDFTNASRTLLFDIGRLRWDENLCALWEIPRRALPEVRESFARFGETSLDGALTRPLPICGVMGDSQAALFGHGCFAPGAAKVTFGTGSSILINIGAKPLRSKRGVLTALAWVRGGVPTYAFEGIIISAASTLVWMRDQLGLLDTLDCVDELASSVPDNGGVYLVPAFSGLGFPYWAPEARAVLSGLSSHSDRRHVVRAALESIAYQLRDAFEIIQAETAVPVGAVHCDGGPTANRFLMQFTADMTGAQLLVAPMADCASLGAARAGLLGLDQVASFAALATHSRDSVTYAPALDHAAVARLSAGWRHAVRQSVRPIP